MSQKVLQFRTDTYTAPFLSHWIQLKCFNAILCAVNYIHLNQRYPCGKLQVWL